MIGKEGPMEERRACVLQGGGSVSPFCLAHSLTARGANRFARMLVELAQREA